LWSAPYQALGKKYLKKNKKKVCRVPSQLALGKLMQNFAKQIVFHIPIQEKSIISSIII